MEKAIKNIVIAFNFVDYSDLKKAFDQERAISVLVKTVCNLKKDGINILPISLNFKDEPEYTLLKSMGVQQINVLERDSSKTIGNNRRMPYVKEIFENCCKINCDVFGYINSDILLSLDVFDLLKMDFDAYILARFDIEEVSECDFLNGNNIKTVCDGDTHCGADGFFFKKTWWDKNRNNFSNDFVLGEPEWDTAYRRIITHIGTKYVDARILHHVYHRQIWNCGSVGGLNNSRIHSEIKRKYV
jgi:hypothetical protein